MKFIQKIHITGFRIYYKLIICFFIVNLWFIDGLLAQNIDFTEITLIDTLHYAKYNVSDIYNNRYPPSNIFDADLKTCWVAGSVKSEVIPSLYLKLPHSDKIVLNIFPGYGKNKELYYKNSRPEKLMLSILAGINPGGYVSEHTVLYKVAEYTLKDTVYLTDSFGIHSVSLDLPQKELNKFKKSVYQYYISNFNPPVGDTCLILKIEIAETLLGTNYDDICISEIFLNDRFITPGKLISGTINKVYLNTEENAILLDDNTNKGIVVYSDISSVLQIIEVSQDKKWAILISMPALAEGRAETCYLLVDLINKEVVNDQLEKSTGGYLAGNEIYFETGEKNVLNIIYRTSGNNYRKVELR